MIIVSTQENPVSEATEIRGLKESQSKYTISRKRTQEIMNSPAYKADQEYAGYVNSKKRREK